MRLNKALYFRDRDTARRLAEQQASTRKVRRLVQIGCCGKWLHDRDASVGDWIWADTHEAGCHDSAPDWARVVDDRGVAASHES